MFTQYLDIKKWAIPGLFFFIFIFSIRLTVNVQYQFLLMAGFEPQTSGLGSDRTTNSATTTANIWTFRTTLVQKWTEFSKVGSKYWNPQKVAKYFYPFAKVAKFCQIWSHWLFSTNWRKRKRWKKSDRRTKLVRAQYCKTFFVVTGCQPFKNTRIFSIFTYIFDQPTIRVWSPLKFFSVKFFLEKNESKLKKLLALAKLKKIILCLKYASVCKRNLRTKKKISVQHWYLTAKQTAGPSVTRLLDYLFNIWSIYNST